MSTHEIVIAVDAPESAEFAAWLEAQGHIATVGNSTGTFVDGVCTSADPAAAETSNRLWDGYCNS